MNGVQMTIVASMLAQGATFTGHEPITAPASDNTPANDWSLADDNCFANSCAETDPLGLENQVFGWLSRNPGHDDEHVALAFGLPLSTAVAIVDSLLAQGLLDFAD